MNASVEVEEKTIEVVEQDLFRRDQYLSLLIQVVLLGVLCLLLLQLIFLLRVSAVPPPTYFQASVKDQLIEEIPLDQSNMEENVLLNWVVQAVMAANTFNFIDYPRIMGEVRSYFTPQGYTAYTDALAKAEIIKKISERKLVLSAVPMDSPYVVLEKPFAGRYMWKIKIPMRFRYQSVSLDLYDFMEIIVVVMRVPTEQSDIGVQILKYDFEILENAY